MKPTKIFSIMDIAKRARNLREVFNPLFVGPPGVGKSQIVQAWCVKNNLPFIDLRSAYLEAPDLIGFPSISNHSGQQITVHNTPEFWPIDENWEGVILLEEPNRGTTSVLNCWMQLLTDRKVHKYALPKQAIIAGCINPETSEYDVNTMDAALKDRFEIFSITYDKETFVSYMRSSEWNGDIILFVESGLWNYLPPEEVKNAPGSKYISPRTLSKLNAVLKAGFDKEDEMLLYNTILGANVGKDFYNFKHDENPVLYIDLLKSTERSIEKLKRFSDPSNFKSGMISITVKDILGNENISDDLLATVLLAIPFDQGTMLLRDLELNRKDNTLLTRICKNYPEIKAMFKTTFNAGKKK